MSMSVNLTIEYEEVKNTEEHFKLLYKSLKERVYSVSHKVVPKYSDHIRFVKNNPYRKWFIIFLNKGFIGSFYLTFDNGIGLNIDGADNNINKLVLNYILLNFKPLDPVKSVRPDCFYINIPITNYKIEETVVEIGGVLTQKSYNFRS
jgi:hypothetical protein